MLKNAPPRFLPNPEKNWGPKSAAKIKQTLPRKKEDLKDDKNNTDIVKNPVGKNELVKNKRIKK